MKKTLALILTGMMVIGALGFTFADAKFGPAQIYSSLAYITVEEAYELKLASGKTFGDMAKEIGIYEAFQSAVLGAKVTMIEGLVAEGKLTQTEADALIVALENCDGTKSDLLKSTGLFGQGSQGQGNQGQGQGNQAQRLEKGSETGQMKRLGRNK